MKYFDTEVRVIYADTDAMGIVYHANYIKWFEIGRNEFLRNLGYTYARMEEEGVWLPVVNVTCDYKKPGRYDDVLTIRSWIKEMGAATIVMGYEIYNKANGDLLVTGSTKHGITSPDLKPVRLRNLNPELYEKLTDMAKND